MDVEAKASLALIGGSESPVERDAVVFIRANHDDGSFDDCTGTLVSPRMVITAKHCVTLVGDGEFVCTGAGALVANGQGAGLFGAAVQPESIDIFTGVEPAGAPAAHGSATFATESSDACHDDIAALVLDTPVELDAYPPMRNLRPTVVGESVRLVGYGTGDHAPGIVRRERDDIRVIDVGSDVELDDPGATTPPRTFVVGGATGCSGDSGGPALSMETGALAGVYSRITGDCFAAESRNTFTLASSFSSLLTRAFEEADETPQLESELDTIPTSTGGAAGKSGGTAGAAGVTDGADASRHDALACSLGRVGDAIGAIGAGWLALLLLGGSIRRRCVRSPSGGD